MPPKKPKGGRRRIPSRAELADLPPVDVPSYPYKVEEYGDYFEILKVSLREVREGSADGVAVRFHAPTEEAIRRAYRRFVLAQWRPELQDVRSFLTGEAEFFRAGMEAYCTLISPSTCAEYVKHALKPLKQGGGRAEGGHEGWIKSERREPYLSHPIPDAHVLVVEDVLAAAEDKRGEYGGDIDALRGWFKEELKPLPGYLRADRLEAVDVLNVEELIRALIQKKPDIQPLQRFRIVADWRRSAWSSYGSTVVATPKPLTAAERDRWPLEHGITPAARLTLALDHWLACDSEQRETLVFKALCRLEASEDVVKLRHPEVRTSPAVIDEYGITTQAEADLVVSALNRPTLPLELERFGHVIPRQTYLFGGSAAK